MSESISDGPTATSPVDTTILYAPPFDRRSRTVKPKVTTALWEYSQRVSFLLWKSHVNILRFTRESRFSAMRLLLDERSGNQRDWGS